MIAFLAARAVMMREFLAYRRVWWVFLSGFVEPVLYLFSIGIGVGGLVEGFTFNGETIGYAAFVAPAMLAASAFNGALLDSTYNFFFKFKINKLFDQQLATPLTTRDLANGNLAWMMLRSGDYSAGFLAVMLLMGYVTSWWAVLALPAALLLGFAEVVRDNSAQTLMASIVDKSQLERANGRLWGAETAMNNFVGPPLGGVIIAVGLALPFFLNAGLLAVGAALIFGLTGSFLPKGTRSAGKIRWREEMGEGFGWLWRHRLLRTLALMLGAMNLLSAVAFIVMVLFVQEVLGLYEGWQFGVVITGAAVGAVLGSMVVERITQRLSAGTSLLVAIVGMGLTNIAIGLTSWAVVVWCSLLVGGVFIVMWNVITVSLRQRIIPDHLLGRVNSVYRFFGWGTISLGTLFGGVLVSVVEPFLGREWALRTPFLLAGVVGVLLVLVALPRLSTAKIEAAQAAAEAEQAAAETELGAAEGQHAELETPDSR